MRSRLPLKHLMIIRRRLQLSNFKELTKGVIKENPVLVTLLGMCPTLGMTTNVKSAFGLSVATAFVLLCSNVVIALVKNLIPKAVRLPSYIVIIAGFVTFVDFMVKGYLPELYDSLGIYLPLITVNCIILGRAEVFASKNSVGKSALDAIGMGIGFIFALVLMGSIREIIGAGSWYGHSLHISQPFTLMVVPAGGFLTLGVIIAVVNRLANRKPPKEIGCGNCANKGVCHGNGGNN